MTHVDSGLDHFLANPPDVALGSRLGLLTNPSGIDHTFRSAIDLILEHPKLNLVALFGPEHGVRGEAQAGEHVEAGTDPRTGLPAHSLYGDTRRPTAEMLDGIDVMVVDLQDIGVRYATYLSSIAYVIDACADHGKQVVILDRPNPLGGTMVGGNLLDPEYASFVGIHAIPTVHGLTMGEFGRLWASDHQRPEPVIVPMGGWRRDMWYDDTDLSWVFPSPNLPTLDSVELYPATCLIEGTVLSEGRGTTRPFEMIGAPWIEPETLAGEFRQLNVPGVAFRPVYFTPAFSKHEGERCGGVQLYVTDRSAFDGIALGPHMLATIKRLYPDDFAWIQPRNVKYFIDLLAGGTELRTTIDEGGSIDRMLESWQAESQAFTDRRKSVLLY
jgi:uncharacterized protein YbbC (DUF1343 family)